jgi:dienelactone hydrolase
MEFESEDAVLRVYLYKAAKGDPPHPLVVMAHGTSATIPMVADRYAEVFAEAGVSALLYDHRNLPPSSRGIPPLTPAGHATRRRAERSRRSAHADPIENAPSSLWPAQHAWAL